MHHKDTRKVIIDAISWNLWAQAWISWSEEHDGPRPVPGGCWDLLVPEAPFAVRASAEHLAQVIERLNNASLDQLFERAAAMPGRHYREPTPSDFGHCIAYHALGCGVSWEDNHPATGQRWPHMNIVTFDGETADISDIDERFC